jgi:hypothetical protein
MAHERYKTLGEFWPYYVREHRQPWTRRMHFIGNTNLLVWLLLAALQRSPSLLVGAVVSSYALAWIGHFFIERNLPATFKYPLLSALADMLMYAKMWQGQMDSEVARYTQEDAAAL